MIPEPAKTSAAPERPLAALWLALAPVASLAAVALFPRWALPEARAVAVATAAAVLPAIVGMTLAARSALRPSALVALAGLGAAGVVALYARGVTSAAWLPIAAAAEVSAAWGVGSLIGARVEHAGHVLPAAFVAAAADTVSVLHPSGASHAIARSDRALSVLALGAPVPGTDAVTFALGVGDLTFAALLFAVAVRHGISLGRVFVAVLVGVGASLAAAALTGAPIPALVGIGGAATLLVPRFREVRRRERTVTGLAVAGSIAVVLGMLARARLG